VCRRSFGVPRFALLRFASAHVRHRQPLEDLQAGQRLLQLLDGRTLFIDAVGDSQKLQLLQTFQVAKPLLSDFRLIDFKPRQVFSSPNCCRPLSVTFVFHSRSCLSFGSDRRCRSLSSVIALPSSDKSVRFVSFAKCGIAASVTLGPPTETLYR
jgi:hypothetical protein